MLIDSNLELADNTALPSTGTLTDNLVIGGSKELRANIADNATADLSGGEPIYLVIEVTAIPAGSLATYNFTVFSHSSAVSAGDAAAGTLLFQTGLTAKTSLPAGKRFIVALPEAEYAKHIMVAGAANATGGGVITSGNINAFFTKDVVNWTGSATRVPATDPAN
ncbi:MAG: hypothetical protein Unbinned7015contig1001_7 [Prokaryotic dsDNA virus sp.]|nr:MAG: hypothetical protein Unbinned7015contig1001_7 [Prokaryotic dsDNA virus sp.]|tara:strand:- start:13009 stop:13503 length:495 start_codon:yes stop_codon:yes gene_type:complete